MRDDAIIIRRDGRAGRITLNRPDVLNALNHTMVLAIEQALIAWRDDPQIALVIIDATGSRAFCAGGDINSLYEQGKAGDFASGIQFWRDEYRLNAMIANYPKPYVAVMNGIVMGGGVGVSALGSHRIATENTVFALPECSIGLVPDVGSTHLLAQAPGHLGEFLATTGFRLKGHDAVYAGVADAHVSSSRIAELIGTLVDGKEPSALAEFADAPVQTELRDLEPSISAVFSGETLMDVISKLEAMDAAWTTDALKALGRNSPLSCRVAFDLIRAARANSGVPQALEREFCFVAHSMEHGDFLEGIRAAIIDKDRSPRWQHNSIATVPDADIAIMKQPPESGLLSLR